MSYRVTSISGREALRWIQRTHRHLPRLQGALFAVAVERDGVIVGVATAGHPPRVWMGSGRIVISRCAALPGLPAVVDSKGDCHAAPVCTMLYRAICDAARALGWREAWTYTLPGEDGRSLRAAGFVYMGETRGEEHDRPSRARAPAVCAEPKGRWMRQLVRERIAA